MNTTPDTAAYFIQFPHPGREHVPAGEQMPWNTGPHARKFLRGHGRYLDRTGTPGEADLVFWGEWEAPSRIIDRWPSDGGKPRALHAPHWCAPPNGPRQNTDPWVFGTAFRYSNCRQLTAVHHVPSRMQHLTAGSVIVFGSTLADAFVVDTVFVVASADTWTPSDPTSIPPDEAFHTCTAQSLAAGNHPHAELTLYTGATYDQPVNGMYSFVPARRADDPAARFERPPLHLPRWINPKSTQSTLGTKRPMTPAEVHDAWNSARSQILARCLLATHLETPPHTSQAPQPRPPSATC